MPLYEYVCDACRHEVEVLVRSETERPSCPDCGSDRLQKLLSVPAGHTSNAAAPAAEPRRQPPAGPCGSACGCFPH